jgi:hypothetical protein
MAWETWTAQTPYKGFKVGRDYLNLSKELWADLRAKKWERVAIDYDPEEKLIRLRESKRGAKITKHGTIAATIPMPMVRYELQEEREGYLYFGLIN